MYIDLSESMRIKLGSQVLAYFGTLKYIFDQPIDMQCLCINLIFQKKGGLIFPDRATLYVTAIEDRQYKDEKINCE